MITGLGSGSIGLFLPGPVGALLSAEADLEARIAAMAQFQAVVSLPTSAQIVLAGSMVTSLSAALAAGVEAPSLSAQIDIMAAQLAVLQAQLMVIQDLLTLCATAGVHGYAFEGDADQFGPEFTAELAGGFPGGAPSDTAHAIVLATTSGATWTAMQGVFKVTP
jgi:hypothetical protein